MCLRALWDWSWVGAKENLPVSIAIRVSNDFLFKYRIFAALCCWIMVSYEFWLLDGEIWRNGKYFTHWGVALSTFFYTLAIIQTIREKINGYVLNAHDCIKLSKSGFFKFTIAFFNVTWTFQLSIFLFYWLCVYLLKLIASKRDPSIAPPVIEPKDVFYHGGLYLFILIENTFNTIKLYPRQAIYPTITVLAYAVVNFLYVKITGTPVYPYITWDNWYTVAFVAIVSICFYIQYKIGEKYYSWKRDKYFTAQMKMLTSDKLYSMVSSEFKTK